MPQTFLVPHPNSPAPNVAELSLIVQRDAGGELRLHYRLSGELPALKLEPFTQLRRQDKLWEHTCFELFIRAAQADSYCELNVAPSGAWAVYAFMGYRAGMQPVIDAQPRVVVRREPQALHVQVTLSLQTLEKRWRTADLQLAPAAVIEDASGQRSYWATRHAAAQPDFHHGDAFVVALPAVQS